MRYSIFLITFIIYSCSKPNSEYILNEEFDSNKLGWIEETTEFHRTEILDGELLISSLDTASRISSNGPRDNSYLWSLPVSWEFETSIKIIDGGADAGFGFKLYSASINYSFSLNRNGSVNVYEYDYNSEKNIPIIEKSIADYKLDFNTPVSLLLVVKDSNSFEFFIDGISLGNGKFRAKSWGGLRLFAESGGTGIKVNFYRLKQL